MPPRAPSIKPLIKSPTPVNERAEAGFQILLSNVGLSACKANCLVINCNPILVVKISLPNLTLSVKLLSINPARPGAPLTKPPAT